MVHRVFSTCTTATRRSLFLLPYRTPSRDSSYWRLYLPLIHLRTCACHLFSLFTTTWVPVPSRQCSLSSYRAGPLDAGSMEGCFRNNSVSSLPGEHSTPFCRTCYHTSLADYTYADACRTRLAYRVKHQRGSYSGTRYLYMYGAVKFYIYPANALPTSPTFRKRAVAHCLANDARTMLPPSRFCGYGHWNSTIHPWFGTGCLFVWIFWRMQPGLGSHSAPIAFRTSRQRSALPTHAGIVPAAYADRRHSLSSVAW